MKKEVRNYLSIKDKKRLLSQGKKIRLCAYVDSKEERKRKKEKKELDKKFARNVGF